MSKKQAHIILFFGDLLALGAIIILYHELSQIILETSNQVEMIRFGNRTGFLILGVGALLIHPLVIVEYFWPEYIKKNNMILSIGLIAVAITLLAAGFIGSMWMTSKVESAGYVYCRKASGASALAKTLVYTKNIDICEELVETKRKR